ncbi:ester cyclase [Pseudomonas syringae]|uniref:nuclear transport factor 2 family protein n=1 Tax=Pseudomonas syringae TaxID=317 RepID=UPI001F29E610|nr:nuclear transport factor 2 family protein [Pseudomonas syringae]MCF5721866.1 hypothetical protein [Pseudomonas syringae]
MRLLINPLHLRKLLLISVLGLVSTGLAAAPSAPRDLGAEEQNRALVLKFYDQVFNQHHVETGTSVMADNYKQHNPLVPDGKKPFVSYFTQRFSQFPEAKSRVIRSATQDDLVNLHVHSTQGPQDLGRAIVDIFRVKNGLIVEHWDVIQPVPDKAKNENTMF